jgi:Bacterial extracellular solute-binding proteins, family 5 Middle
MVIAPPLPLVTAFIDCLDVAIQKQSPGQRLSSMQRLWLAFCLTAILVSNSACWARFERPSLGTYALAALSWMLRHAKIPWALLLVASRRVLLYRYGIMRGSLGIEDTEKKRSKSAKQIAYLHQLCDKERGGCILSQNLVFLLCVTAKVTLLLGFAFYRPAPEPTAWYKQEQTRKRQDIPSKHRPPTPPPNPQSPTKPDLALRLLQQCKAPPTALTVHFHFKELFLDFPIIFGTANVSGAGWIVPAKYYQQVGAERFKQQPIGAGPYKLVRQEPGVRIELEAFADYYRPVHVKQLVMIAVPEVATRVAMLERGEADIIYLVPGELIETVGKIPGVMLAPVLSGSW